MDERTAGAVAWLLNGLGRRFRYGVDLGCGYGNYAPVLKRYVGYLVGVDKSWLRLFFARLNGYDRVVLSDVRAFEVPRDCDVVFMFDVLEHLPKEDGLTLLDKWSGRTVVVTTPSKFYPLTFMDSHVSLWTVEELQRLGFQTYLFETPPLLKAVYGDKILAVKL